MNFALLAQAFALIDKITTAIATFKGTPVGASQTVTFGDKQHVLEISASGEHWVCTAATFERVK